MVSNTKNNAESLDQETLDLLEELSKFENEIKINKYYNECKEMVDDVTLDSNKRKNQILTNTKTLLSDTNIISLDAFKLIENGHIMTEMNDTENVLNAMEICGNMMAENKALPPIIEIKNIESTSIEIVNYLSNNDKNNIIGYRLIYGECNNDDINNMEIEWKTIDIDNNDNNDIINYNIESLNPSTNYLIYGICKDIKGFGEKSKPIVFKTSKQSPFIFDIYTKGQNKLNNIISNKGKIFMTTNSYFIFGHISAANSIGMKSRSCTLKIYSTKWFSMGITSEIENCKTNKSVFNYVKGKTYYAMSHGKARKYGEKKAIFNFDQWENGDIIKMEWDCNGYNGILTYYVNKVPIGQINIDEAFRYYPFVNTDKKTEKYEIYDDMDMEINDNNKPLPPIILIKDVKATSIKLNIKTEEDNIIGYRLMYGQCIDDDTKYDVDDIKTEWKTIDIDNNNDIINYDIESLESSTNYIIYGLCKNAKGFGERSEAISLKTKQALSFIFDICTKGKNKLNNVIQDNGKTFSTLNAYYIFDHMSAANSIGMKSRSCTFKIHSTNWFAMGITSDLENCKTNKSIFNYNKGTTYYAINNGNGYQSGNKEAIFNSNIIWKKGDIIKMQWDCNDHIGLLTFYVNKTKIGQIDIDETLKYYPLVNTDKKTEKYEICCNDEIIQETTLKNDVEAINEAINNLNDFDNFTITKLDESIDTIQ